MIFINNKYTKWYFNIIYKSQDIKIIGKTELHHILPKSIYPEFKNLNKHNWNGVYLTYREHYICHWLLTKMTSDSDYFKMLCAFNYTNSTNSQTYNTKITSKTYTILKKELSQVRSNHMKTYWLTRSAASINLSNNKMAETIANKSESELADTSKLRSESIKQVNANKTPLEREVRTHNTKVTWNNKSAAEKESHARKISKIVKGKKHYTDGMVNKMCFPEDVPFGFYPGRIIRK